MTTTTQTPRPFPTRVRPRLRARHAVALAAVAVVAAAAFVPDDATRLTPTAQLQAAGSESGLLRERLSDTAAGSRTFGAAKAATPTLGRIGGDVPITLGRAEQVASATLVLVDGRSGIERAIDRARNDLGKLGGHTVSFNETEGTPTADDPCPLPIDAYAGGAMRSVRFPCPAAGEHSDAAQLVMAVPVPNVETLLRSMGGYGEILGRSTQITDAQASIDQTTARIALVDRQIARLQALIASTTGDSSALRRQLAAKVATRSGLESSRLDVRAEVRFAQVAMNVTTVRPTGSATHRNGFVRAVRSGWHRLLRLGQRSVSVLVVALPILAVLAIVGWPLAGRLRRRAAPEVPQAPH